jgi:hypothetical protein
VNIFRETVRKILTEDIDMRNVCAQMVPNELHEEQKHGTVLREFVATKQITVLEQHACSPDLDPNDFFVFPKMKMILKGRHFNDIYDIRYNTTAALKVIPQNKLQIFFCRLD